MLDKVRQEYEKPTPKVMLGQSADKYQSEKPLSLIVQNAFTSVKPNAARWIFI
jgi:hypothetical protein